MPDDLLRSRMILSSKAAVKRLQMDLSGLTVVTECATGVYSCTPLIAALAGAEKVVAFGRNSSHGTFIEAKERMESIWNLLDLDIDRLCLTDSRKILIENLRHADIVTNSGHLRPLNSEIIYMMKKGCVIPLMYEAWEFRAKDISIETCRECDVAVAGTNERHPDIAVFDYLGPIVAKALFDAGLEITGNNILLVSDNDFGQYVSKTLSAAGANVARSAGEAGGIIDAIVFAYTPAASGGTFDISSLGLPGDVSLCCQLWGDVDRAYFNTRWIPEEEPRPGHMGLLLSSLGVEPVVRLQAGGLKVGEIMARARRSGLGPDGSVKLAVEKGFGQELKG